MDKYRKKIDPNLPVPEFIDYKDFKKSDSINQYTNDEQSHIIIISGYQRDVKEFCNDGKWDYDELGIKIKTNNTITLIYTEESIKNKYKNDFSMLEKEMFEKYSLETYSNPKIREYERMFIVDFYKYLEIENAIVTVPKSIEEIENFSNDEKLGLNSLKISVKSAQKEAENLMTKEQKKKCYLTIHTAAVACGACGALPIPIADTIPITATQVAMVVSIGKIFEITIEETVAKTLLSTAITSMAGRTIAGAVLRFVPGIGWTISAGIAAGVTEVAGWLIANDFAKQYRDSKK